MPDRHHPQLPNPKSLIQFHLRRPLPLLVSLPLPLSLPLLMSLPLPIYVVILTLERSEGEGSLYL
jgi:hypothetical protein